MILPKSLRYPRSFAFAALPTLAVWAFLAWTPVADAMETVQFERDGQQQKVRGEVVLESQAGDVVIRTIDDRRFVLRAEEILMRTRDDEPFRMLSAEEYERWMLAQLPRGFTTHSTANYKIFHDTTPKFAGWVGAMFERLHTAFINYWSRRGIDIKEHDRPFTAIVFADRRDYIAFSRPVVGDAVEGMAAYYNLETNQLVLYDMTSSQAADMIATIVHEATHQIAYNAGMHERLSDCPLWAVEGVAMFFETPDLTSKRGWRGIGEVNRLRLNRFRSYLRRRPADSLVTLTTTDARFRDMSQAADAYAEAWSLTYFLARRYPKQYEAYIRKLAGKPSGVVDTPQERWTLFKESFGDPVKLDREFVRYMMEIR